MFEIIRNTFKSRQRKEEEMIRAMFDSRNNRDTTELMKTNSEIKAAVDQSNKTLKGEININSLIPPSGKAQ